MGRPSNTSQRREQITAALLKVMSRQGYEKASVQSIAKEAELSPGLVHYHFKSKQEILMELISSIANVAQQRYQTLVDNDDSAQSRLNSFIDAALALGEGADSDTVAAWVVIGAEAIRQKDVKCAYQQVVKNAIIQLRSLITQAGSETNIKLDNEQSHALACSVYGAIEGAYKLSCATTGIIPKNYAAQSIKRMLIASIQSYGTPSILNTGT